MMGSHQRTNWGIFNSYHVVMTHIAMERSTIFKNGKQSISMGHLYHGYVSHNQRVNSHYIPLNHHKSPLKSMKKHHKSPLKSMKNTIKMGIADFFLRIFHRDRDRDAELIVLQGGLPTDVVGPWRRHSNCHGYGSLDGFLPATLGANFMGYHDITHRIHGAAIYGNMDPINIPRC